MRRPRLPSALARRPPAHVGPKAVLATGLLLGLAALGSMATGRPHMLGVNFEVYYYAAEAALSGGSIYATTPPDHPGYYFLYPPVVALAFVPHVLIGDPTVGFALHALVQVAAGVGLAALLVRYVEGRGVALGSGDRLLVGGFVVASVHAVPTHFYGNVNVLLAACLGAAFVAQERGAETRAGVVAALPALVKVFPAVAGLWFLRRRARRAVVAAALAGGGLLLAGALALGPDALAAYATEALLPRFGASDVNGAPGPRSPYITLRQPLALLGLTGSAGSLAALAAVAPVVAYCYTRIDGPVDRLVAVFATLAGTLAALPSVFLYYAYLFFPLVPLLYLLSGRPRRLFLAGALVANLATTVSGGRRAVAALGLPAGVESSLVAGLDAVFAVGQPPLYGVLLMLGACVLHRRER